MGTFVRPSKSEAFEQIRELVKNYRQLRPDITKPGVDYSETETRIQFVDPFLKALGWDVANIAGRPRNRMEVVAERTEVDAGGTTTGRPDYKLRIEGQDVLPIEAKRPQVSIENHAKSSSQARSYGWSLSLPAAVLTNFEHSIIFDTQTAPSPEDSPTHSRLPNAVFTFEEYLSRFDDLWHYLSYESLRTEGIESVYHYKRPPRGESPFDKAFLSDFRRWRLQLGQAILDSNPSLSAREIGRRTQKVINAFVFLRVCEDRNIEKYKKLYESANARTLIQSFKAADRAFNAGLFTILGDTPINDEVLADIVADMYWPHSQYAYALLEPKVLSALYEQYLGEQIVIDQDGKVRLAEKPEVTHAGGVVSTPDFIVRRIVEQTLNPLLPHGPKQSFNATKILDPAVGSGTFLIEAFQQILAAVEKAGGENSLDVRRHIVQDCLFGIDIDPAAVEVARLSLLLLIIGNEKIDVNNAKHLLPSLEENIIVGNTVVRGDFDRLMPHAAKDPLRRAKVCPTDPFENKAAGKHAVKFDAIIGNPPYVRIQEMSAHFPDQLKYLQSENSGYESPRAHNFDLYQVFIERSFEFLKPDGRLGMIIPNRFTNLLSAGPIRQLLGERLEHLVHFRESQVFPGRFTYTALVFTGPKSKESFALEFVDDLSSWRNGTAGDVQQVDRASYGASPWPMSTASQKNLFEQLERNSIGKLGDPEWVEIFVGVQTSGDKLFFLQAKEVDPANGTVFFTDSRGTKTEIEIGILRPAIKKATFEIYDGQPNPDCYVIFPYKRNSEGQMVLYTADELKQNFPLAWDYFLRHKQELSARKITPDPKGKFWAYGRSQSLGKLEKPKLIVRVLSLIPRYARDDQGLVLPGGGDGGPYYLLRPAQNCSYPLNVIQAVLSHPAVDLFVSVTGKKFKGSYAVRRKAFLANVPLPMLNKEQIATIDANTTELQELAVKVRYESDSFLLSSLEGRRTALRKENEDILSSAYGLDPRILAEVTGEI